MANRSSRSVNGWIYALLVAISLILLFFAGEYFSRMKRPGFYHSPRTTTLSVSPRPGTTSRIVSEPIAMQVEPTTEVLDRSTWVEYRTEPPAAIAMVEPPSGVRLNAPIPFGLSDPFQEYAAQPKLAMSESESRDAISVSAVSSSRSLVERDDVMSALQGGVKVSLMTKNWPRAMQLESDLIELYDSLPEAATPSPSSDVACSDVAEWIQGIQALLSELQSTEIASKRSAEILSELRRYADGGLVWGEKQTADDLDSAGAVMRVAYSLKRRVAIWTPVQRCVQTGRQQYVARRSYHVDYGRIENRLAEARKAILTTEDAANWSHYLLLDRLQDLADGQIESREHQVIVAREFLSRVTDQRVTPEQRRILTSAEVHQLADEIHPLTIGPVDYRKVLLDIEAVESDPVHRCGADLADAIQSLRFSEHVEQAAIADAIGTHYRNANIRLSISQDFINRLLPRDQVTSRPVQQKILGADTRGASQVQTNLNVELIPDPAAWHVRLKLNGDIHSSTRSSRSGATFYNTSQALVQSERDVRIDTHSLKIDGSPATVASSDSLRRFSTEWDQLPVLGDMIRYFAHQEFVQSKPVAKRITQRLIAQQTDDEFDRQLKTNLDGAREQFDKRWIGPLQSLELQPMVLDLHTTDSRLVARYRVAGSDQISAHTPRPIAPGDSLISLQLHQSAFNNWIAQAIETDRNWTIMELSQKIADILQVPHPEWSDETPTDVVIRFMRSSPMTIEFEDGRMWLTLKIESLEQPGRIHLKNFVIRTSYVPLIDGLQSSLVREGVISVDGHRLGARDRLPLRAIFTKVFSGRPALPMVSEALSEDPRAQGLAVSQLEMHDGWFAMAISEANSPHVSALKDAASSLR
jgi:hypothetical protein